MSKREGCKTRGQGLCDACIHSGGGANAVKIRGNGHSECYRAVFEFNTGTCVGFRTTDFDDPEGPGKLQAFIDIEPSPCAGVFCNANLDALGLPIPGIGTGLFVPEVRSVEVIDEVTGGTPGGGADVSLTTRVVTNPSACQSAVLFLWYVGETSFFGGGAATSFTDVDILRIDDNGGPLIDGPNRTRTVSGAPAPGLNAYAPGAIVHPVTRLLAPSASYTAMVARTTSSTAHPTVTSGGTRLRGILATIG